MESLQLLRRIVALPGHVFWEDDISLARTDFVDSSKLVGYRQVTDAHLMALTLRHRGRLVTFDRGIQHIIPDSPTSDELLVILD